MFVLPNVKVCSNSVELLVYVLSFQHYWTVECNNNFSINAFKALIGLLIIVYQPLPREAAPPGKYQIVFNWMDFENGGIVKIYKS